MHRSWIFVSVILAGCASYQPKPLDPALLTQRFEARSLGSTGLRICLEQQLGHALAAWPLSRWDRQMLTLSAYCYSPELDIARAQWQGSSADVAVAGARPNPSLQLPFEYTTNHQGAGRPYTTGPMLDIPIETAHKRSYRVAQASRLAEAARLNILSQAWNVRSRVRALMLALYSAQRRVSLLEQQITAQREIVGIMEKRESVGAAAAPEGYRASLALIDAQTALASAQNEVQSVRSQLVIVIGLPVAALASVELELDEFASPGVPLPAADAQRAALMHRADLRAALAHYDASQSALQLEVAKQYPDIHIGPGYTYDVGANKISFGLAGITLPIFNRKGAIAQAEAARAEAAARTVALQDTIITNLAQARAAYLAGEAAERLSASRQENARRLLENEKASFDAGNSDRLALTQARIVSQAAELAHLDAIVRAQQVAGVLEEAMQMPLSTNVSGPLEQQDGVSQ